MHLLPGLYHKVSTVTTALWWPQFSRKTNKPTQKSWCTYFTWAPGCCGDKWGAPVVPLCSRMLNMFARAVFVFGFTTRGCCWDACCACWLTPVCRVYNSSTNTQKWWCEIRSFHGSKNLDSGLLLCALWVVINVLEKPSEPNFKVQAQAVCSSKMMVTSYQIAWCYNPKDYKLQDYGICSFLCSYVHPFNPQCSAWVCNSRYNKHSHGWFY